MEVNNNVPGLLFPENAIFMLLEWHELKFILTYFHQQLYSCLMAVCLISVFLYDLLCMVISLMRLYGEKLLIYPRSRTTQQNKLFY